MRPPYVRLRLIVFSATLAVGTLTFPTPASSNSKLEQVFLRGTFTIESAYEASLIHINFEDEEFVVPSLALNLQLSDNIGIDYSFVNERRLSTWENGELNDRSRPRQRFQMDPFGKRSSFDLWGAEVYKSEIKIRLAEEDSLLGSNPSVAVVWGKGSVAGIYQSEVDLGDELGLMSLRAKIEMRKEQRPEFFIGAPVSISPLDQRHETYYLVELYKKF